MQTLYWLDRIQLSDRSWVGEKACALSQLKQQGFPVIPGFVISAQVLQHFLEQLQWLEPLFADLPHSSLHLDVHNSRQLQSVAQRIRQSILQAQLPDQLLQDLTQACAELGASTLILRPSLGLTGTVRTDGLLETQLCPLAPEAIAHSLLKLWAELFKAKNLLYWKHRGVQVQQIRLAVLMQPLRDAIASGSLEQRGKTWEIQSTWGLGMTLVRGEVVPDLHRIETTTGSLQLQELGRKTYAYHAPNVRPSFPSEGEPLAVPSPVPGLHLRVLPDNAQFALSATHLQLLVQVATRLKATLNQPFSLEWIVENSESEVDPQLYLTQFAPHVTLEMPPPLRFPTVAPSTVVHDLQGLAAAPGRAIAPIFVLQDQDWQRVPPGVILVAPSIAPDWLPALQQAAGIITEQGGLTSHAAIMARELGIPAVIGVPQVTQLFQSGESLFLDGDQGQIRRVGLEEQAYRALSVPETADFPPIATQLMVNLSQIESLERVKHLPVDGVGLLRSELMLLQALNHQHPQRWIDQGRQRELVACLVQQVRQFCLALAPRPVFYRSLDWRSHEFQNLEGSPDLVEANPMLGLRGTFRYQLYPGLFEIELAALVQVYQSGCHNINLLLPFVRTVEEFLFCRHKIRQAGLGDYANFETWIMAEVPSVLLLLPEYVRAGVQGISIGTNDLTQLLLGVDRDQAVLAGAFDERHPAVQQAIAHLIHSARRLGIACTLCGQAPVLYPELIAPLVRWGITGISVDPSAVEATHRAIARAERDLLLSAIRGQPPMDSPFKEF